MAQGPLDLYRLTPQAQADLVGIWRYSADTWSVDQADAYLRDLDQKLRDLCRAPTVARERTEITPPVRLLPHGRT